MNWTDGYVSEIDYLHAYHEDLAPSKLKLALLNKGYAPPKNGRMRYLELGYGQGISLNIHAASCTGEFWGADFHPEHTTNAIAISEACDNKAIILNDSFEELVRRDDLPDFDFICLNGVWSWISDNNRAILLEIIQKRLKPGGVLYNSYNTTPGWSPMIPLRHLLMTHAEFTGTKEEGIKERIKNSIEFAQTLTGIDNHFFRVNPGVKDRLEKMASMNRNYLAHEYFNKDWEPMPFAKVASYLESAKLKFATSANLLDNIDNINFTKEALEFLSQYKNPILQETLKDYFVNQQFRRDIFVKGGMRLSPQALEEELEQIQFILTCDVESMNYEIKGALGQGELKKEVYSPILELLAKSDKTPLSFKELKTKLSGKLEPPTIWQALLILRSSINIGIAQSIEDSESAQKQCTRINDYLHNQNQIEKEINVLASPLLGAGINIDRMTRIFFQEFKKGHHDPERLAQNSFDIMNKVGSTFIKKDKEIKNDEDALIEIKNSASEFLSNQVPIIKRLNIL